MRITKSIKILLYATGTLLVLFGMSIYWASREIPLPSNAKKIGDMIHIDISEGATNPTERAQANFVVPEKFKPSVSDSVFAVYIKFPDGTPYSGNDFPLPNDQIRVVVKHYAKAEALPSESLLRRLQIKDGGLKNVPYFVKKKDGVEMYQYDYGSNKKTIGTYFKFTAADGSKIIADDPGDWSRDYEVNRRVSPHIALIYLPPKNLIRSTHLVEDMTTIDDVVLKLVRSMQSK